MENIKFEITEQDIKEYLMRHITDENIKYREAMFVKYMKEGLVTTEAMEILMWKYNNKVVKPTGIYMDVINSPSYKMFHEFPNFNKYLSEIKNLDLSGICHILIPTLKYYRQSEVNSANLYRNLDIIANTLLVPIVNNSDVIESTLDDYRICEKVEIEGNIIKIKMSKEHCNRKLEIYQDYYDETKVKKIIKIVKEIN